ncbi:hypothetical protein NBRC116493_16420 [Aurantivibrio infirmus]
MKDGVVIYDGYITVGSSIPYSGKSNGVYVYSFYNLTEQTCYPPYNICIGPFEVGVGVTQVTVALAPPTIPAAISFIDVSNPPAVDIDGGFSVNWGASANNPTSYELEQRLNSGNWSQVYSGSGLSKPFGGLTDGSYEYRARACSANGCSGYTATQVINIVKTPGTPGSVSFSGLSHGGSNQDSDGGYTLTWGASSGTGDYILQESLNGSAFSIVQDSSELFKVFSGKTDGNYQYRAQKCNQYSCSSWTSIASVQVVNFASTPGSIVGPNSANGGYNLSWGAANGTADSYILERRVHGGTWGVRQDENALSVVEASLSSNTYEYRVQACNSLSCSSWTSVHTVDVVVAPGVPSSINVSPTTSTDGNFTIDWGVSSGVASSYNLERQDNGGAWTSIATISNAPWTYTDTELSDGDYSYRVRGCHTLGSTTNCSAYATSSPSVVSIPSNSPPTLAINAPLAGGQITLGDPVALLVTATDDNDGDLSSSVQWSSNLDGVLGSGDGLIVSSLSLGIHTITASVADSSGLSASTNTNLTVVNSGSGGSGSREVFNGTFDAAGDTQGFAYLDDAFRNSASPNYASGNQVVDASCDNGGCLYVELAGIDSNNITDMSGAWQKSFTLNAGESASITFRYFFDQGPNYEPSEFSEALFSVDGVLIGTQGNDYLFHVAGDGDGGPALSTSGWITETFDLGELGAGTHTIEIGAYNNYKTSAGEFTSMWIDDVVLTATGGVAGNTAPTINISAPASDASFIQGQTITFTSTAIDVEEGDISALIQWSSNLDGSLGFGGSININSLTTGSHQITASVADSSGALSSDVLNISVNTPANNAPTLSITQPSMGSQITVGNSVTFSVSATDAIDGDLSGNVQWVSNIDGLFGVGDDVTVNSLSVGTHIINASVVNSSGLSALASTNLTVLNSGSGSGGSGNREVFSGTFDSSGDTQGFIYLDDVFKNSASPNYASGNHVIDSSCDNGGCLYVELAGIDSNNITDMSGAWQKSFTLNAGESASISFRYFFDQGPNYEPSEFSEAIFAVDGVQIGTQGNDYLFHVAGDGDGGVALSTNGWITETFDLGQLGAGTHTIDIGAYNNYKTSAGEFTSMWIDDVVLTATGGVPSNTAPSVNIIAPTGASSFPQGQTVIFSAMANDAEDGDLSSSIQWSSNLDGILGSGGLINVSSLSLGPHQITASITDLDGSMSTNVITVDVVAVIDTPPTISITSPIEGSTFSQSSNATFTASATDAQDGDLSAFVQWSSHADGVLGLGSSFSTNVLSVGNHQITALITDSAGFSDTQRINITVNANAPSVPGAISYSNPDNDGTFDLSWGLSPGGASSYELQRKSVSGSWTTIQNNSSAIRNEIGLVVDSYSYRVRACDFGACSAWGGVVGVSVTTTPSIIPATIPGVLEHLVDVDANGSLSLSIGIDVPEGVNGLTPSLRFNYHQSSTWHVNRWKLGGVSQINRSCSPSTLLIGLGLSGDGALVQDVDTTNGEVYRSILNYKTRVEKQTDANGDPWYIALKDGKKYKYGITSSGRTDTCFDGPGNDNWLLEEIEDEFGNVISINYDGSIAYKNVSSIEYAGRRVEFSYTNDPIVTIDTVLTNILILVNGVPVTEYRLERNPPGGASGKLLNTIQKCGFDQTGSARSCSAATTFDWTIGQVPGLTTLDAITNGFGIRTEIDYKNPVDSDASIYQIPDTEIPVDNYGSYTAGLSFTHQFVTQIRVDDGIGGQRVTDYRYRDLPSVAKGNTVVRKTLPDGTYLYTSYYPASWGSTNDANTELSGVVSGEGHVYRQARYSGIAGQPGARRLSFVENDVQDLVWSNGQPHPISFLFSTTMYKVPTSYKEHFLNEQGDIIGGSYTSYSYDWDAALGVLNSETATTVVGYDTSGETIATKIEKQSTTTTTYSNDIANWIIAFKAKIETDISVPDLSESKGVKNEYFVFPGYNTFKVGQLIQSVNDGQGFYQKSTSTLDYSAKGNLISTIVSGSDFNTRTTQHLNYVDDIYPGTVVKPTGTGHALSNDFTYDLRFGEVSHSVDTNTGLSSSETYNDLGQLIQKIQPNGTVISTSYDFCSGSCGSIRSFDYVNPAFKITITTTHPFENIKGAPTDIKYFDALGRVIRTEKEGFNTGEWVAVDTLYNHLGLVEQRSLPYVVTPTATPEFVIYEYENDFHLLERSTYPDSGSVYTEYERLNDKYRVTTTETVARVGASKTQVAVEEYNSLGLVIKKIDASGTLDEVVSDFKYDQLDNLRWSRVNGDNTTVVLMSYDGASNRVLLSDPNTGTTNYFYDGLNQLKTKIDARQLTTQFSYDDIGRLNQRIVDFGGVQPATHIWNYDTLLVGFLSSRASPGFFESYNYDSLGQVDRIDTTIDLPNYTNSFTSHLTYDNFGREKTQQYPSGLTTRSEYNAQGYSSEFREHNTNKLLTLVNNTDSFGNIVQQTFGNGLQSIRGYDSKNGRVTSLQTGVGGNVQNNTYDWWSNGTLHQRANLRVGATETFTYDNLNRLDIAQTNYSGGSRNLDFEYDKLGNVLAKTGGGNDLTNYTYTDDGRPHSVNSVQVNGVQHDYDYDNAGNMIFEDTPTDDEDRRITYDASGLPVEIVKGDLNTPVAKDTFEYDADGKRFYKETLNQDDTTIAWPSSAYDKTIYLYDGKFELNIPAEGNVNAYEKTKFNEVLHIREVTLAGATTRFEYLHTDYLGSIDVITDDVGSVVRNNGFDPFGERRDESWTQLAPEQSIEDQYQHTSRGFTGHEHLETTGLIHMNGRVYDPILGRFMSADPYIQAPYFSQSYNRYSYVLNNPLKYSDPTGELFFVPVMIGIKVVGWGMTAYGASQTVKEAKKAYDNYQETGEIDGAGVVKNLAITAGGTIVLSKAKYAKNIVEKIAPNQVKAIEDKISDGFQKLTRGSDKADAPGVDAQPNGANRNGTGADKKSDLGDQDSKPNEKTYQTYTKTNPETGEVYCGRTSGCGTPEQNIARRDSGHHMNEKGFAPADLDRSSTNPDAIRGREQRVIESNGGAKRSGGTSGNEINGISEKNAKREQYLKAADDAESMSNYETN